MAVSACGGSAPVVTATPPSAPPAPVCAASPRAPLYVRLDADEYDATVRDLLGDDAHPSAALPREDDPLELAVPRISPSLAAAYFQSAETLAERAERERLATLAPCVAAGDESEACARETVTRLGRRAYRRPLTDAELARLVALQRDAGFRPLLVALLTSPHFLHRIERGDVLDGYERASRLSYFLWGSMPDDALLDAAGAGALEHADALETQARRMLADARARPHLARFVVRWLELSQAEVSPDEEVYPTWRPELAAALDASTERFVEHVLFESSGTLRELLDAPYAFVDDALAPLYDVSAPGTSELVRLPLDRTQRAGLLTQPAFLTAHATPDASSPSRRGRALRERLLCQPLPAPPDDVSRLAPRGPDATTTRARFEAHVTDAECASCHTLMDPLGFALEGYDAIGRFRTEEDGVRVDTRGEITGTRATDGALEDGVALAHRLATSRDVARCASERAWQLALRRTLVDADACDRATLDEAWERSGGRLDELFVAIVRSDAFVASTERP